MRKLFLILPALLISLPILAQQHPLSRQIFALVNAARTNPSEFLKKHQEDIEDFEPKYIALLQKAKPLPAATWDTGIVAMCKSAIEANNLDPKYKGNKKLCGHSSGESEGYMEKDALYFVCQFYTVVHDPDYRYLGLYFNKAYTKYAYNWGISCEKTLTPFTFSGKVDVSKVDFNRLNTAKNETYLTKVEREMVQEINLARAYPKVYAQIVAQYLAKTSDKENGLSHVDYMAGTELIEELKNATPVAILKPMRGVYNAAKSHGLDCKQRGFLAHEGSDGKDPWDRILKHCPKLTMGNENLVSNAAPDVRVPVLELLIDGGIPSRGHRYNMLDADWRYVGVYRYVAESNAYYTLYNWVQNFGH